MKYLSLIIPIVVCLAVGMTAGVLQSDAVQTWYPHLNKSALTPPDAAFPVAWTILYILMGISIGLILRDKKPGYPAVTALFAAQLAANFLWSILFFTFHNPVAGLVDISILLILLLVYARRAWPLCRACAWLFLPYIAWVAFAWYLNLYVVLHN